MGASAGASLGVPVAVVERGRSLVVLAAVATAYNLVHKGRGNLIEDGHRWRSAGDNLQGLGRPVQSLGHRAGKPGLDVPHPCMDRASIVDHSPIDRERGNAGQGMIHVPSYSMDPAEPATEP